MNRNAELEREGLVNRRTRWVKRPDINRPADQDLALAATDAIECLTTVPPETVKVTARNGWLFLEGTVDWREQRNTLEDVTRHLPGVRGVTDAIAIKAEL